MSSDVRTGREAELIWLRDEPGARRPAHSRAQIAAAAVAIADSEGFAAVSMRRVAHELGAGTMTLYHYVRNKDELLTLMHDHVMSEVLVPDGELPAQWRPALRRIAQGSRAAFQRHRWTIDVVGDIGIGPNAMRHFEQSLQAVSGAGLSTERKLEAITLVDDYVLGYSLREALDWNGGNGLSWMREALEFFQRQLDSGTFPHASELYGGDARASLERVVDVLAADRFDAGLETILDGIEMWMEGDGSRGAGRRPRAGTTRRRSAKT
jgi:AcrR family transcriptional regulator